MNYRACLVSGYSLLLVCVTGSQLKASDAPAAGSADQATIYYSSAPWDGAAYDLEIPLEHADEGAQPVIRIDIWGYPRFPEPRTLHFSGREDAGGGPSMGDGRAEFQARLNKTMPERLMGTVSFKSLQNDQPVSGNYEFATLDGRKRFKGNFQAVWGNKPDKVIR